MVTAPQFGKKPSNQAELANFRHAPFAKLTLVTVSEEQAALNLAAEAERKAKNKAVRKAEEAAAKQRQIADRLTQNVSLVGCITALPDEAGLKAVHSFKLRNTVTPRPTAVVIPAEVLARGLEEDRRAEEARRAEERAQNEESAVHKERLRLGYIQDVTATALSYLRRDDINLEAKVLLLEEMGCQYSANMKNGRDAVYFHQKSGAEILVRGGALAESQVARPKKARGVEALSPEDILKRQEANTALREEGKRKRMAAKAPKVKTPKSDKNKKDDKKSKKGGAQQ